MNWDLYENFIEDEFRCQHTGLVHMDETFMQRLQNLRTDVGEPFVINSGYRHKTHPIEAAKEEPGEHYEGKAGDIKCWGELAYKIVSSAPKHGFTRIGIYQNQKKPVNSRFIHLGTSENLTHPTIWSE